MSETGGDREASSDAPTPGGQAQGDPVTDQGNAITTSTLTAEPHAGRASRSLGRGKLLTKPRRSTVVLTVIALVSGLAFATVFAILVTSLTGKNAHAPVRTTGIPKTVSTKLANMMQLSPVPVSKAPGFTLTDQSGHPVSLASLHGHPVVLTFMDPHCTDICPLVSREFINAYKDLGTAGRNVVFIAVNVNPYHHSTADMAKYSNAEGLSSIPTWHFVTGSVPSLHKVWNNYDVQVQAPNPDADVIHTSLVYFIDRQGKERFVAAPMVDHTKSGTSFLPPGQLAEWGKGIALVTRAASH
jgi:cytochrome oxidase Cu insertion factor (SCO1/SenC/PrrC family)